MLTLVVGPKTCSGLETILQGAKLLERLTITMDKASMVGTAPARASNSDSVLSPVASTTFQHLRFCWLQGWVVSETLLDLFMSKHKNILHELELFDCVVLGNWQNVLKRLLGSESLHFIRLRQLGSDFHRVEFPSTCDTFSSRPSEIDEWYEVDRSWFTTRILPWQNWDLRLDAIIHDLDVTTDVVDPAANDADEWNI
jgi:hypothetical protein